MLSEPLPMLVPVYNLAICLKSILENAQFDTVALVHLNVTSELADTVHGQLMNDTNYAWMRFNMANNKSLDHPMYKDNLFKKIFFLYFLDDLIDWVHVLKFLIKTQLNFRDNHIYIVNKYKSVDYIKEVGSVISKRQFVNSGILFWNASEPGHELEAYTSNGFKFGVVRVPLVDSKCHSLYGEFFYDKLRSFYGIEIMVFGVTEPPRLVRTVAVSNGRYEYGIGGHDMLLVDTVCKHVKIRPKYKLLQFFVRPVNAYKYEGGNRPDNNTELRIFNVSETSHHNWTLVDQDGAVRVKVFVSSTIAMNSEQMKFNNYMETLHVKDWTYLYPHDTGNYVIIVPKRFRAKTEYDQILKSPLLIVWVPITLSATIFRFIFNKIIRKNDENLLVMFLQTFGLSLGMSFNAVNASASEKLLLWWFCLGTMLSGMLLSSSMFQGFALQLNVLTINNLEELEISKMKVQAPTYSESVEHFFRNIPQKLNLEYIEDFEISDLIANRNTSFAYVVREGKYNILFNNDCDTWHIIQRFGFEHLSLKLRLFSVIEGRMNDVIQRCIDHGIVKYLVAKNKRLLGGIRMVINDKKMASSVVNPVAVSDIKNPFLLYALGIVLSAVAYIAERMV